MATGEPYEHDMRGGGCSNYCHACNHAIGMAIAKDAIAEAKKMAEVDMESKGPYKAVNESGVEGPGLNRLPQSGRVDLSSGLVATVLNIAYEEGTLVGRKSMEKDFKELLKLASGMRPYCIDDWALIWGRQFDAWKKTKGLI